MRFGHPQAAILAILLSGGVTAGVEGPERKVAENVITSERDPAVQIRLPKSVKYVGADRWELYGIADCELHVFVETDRQRSVQRLYWVQFEDYLPTKPDLKHQYDSPRHTTIGGLDFYVDTWPRAREEKTRAGSDLEHVMALLRGKGYEVPAGMMYVRLVHLLDEHKRKELMIIYAEDLASAGLTAADLQPGGSAHAQWPVLEKGLLKRAESRIKIAQTVKP